MALVVPMHGDKGAILKDITNVSTSFDREHSSKIIHVTYLGIVINLLFRRKMP